MKHLSLLALTFFSFYLSLMPSVEAQDLSGSLDLSRYQRKVEFSVNGIVTPKVIKMESGERIEGRSVLMKKKSATQGYTKADVMPHKIVKAWEKYQRKNTATVSSVSSTFEGDKRNMVDGDYNTFMTFDGDNPVHKMSFTFPRVTEVSSIRMTLGKGVLPPRTISIEGVFENGKKNYIERSRVFRSLLSWPPVRVKELTFSITSPHLFRVAEVDFGGTEVSAMKDEVVFFAEDGETYVLYFDTQFGAQYYSAAKYQPLSTDNTTPQLALPPFSQNLDYNPDFDEDGVNDLEDLCPKIQDASNADIDGNGRGDVCEDPDQDAVMSSKDNCPYVYNRDQKDSDKDGLGDACDDEESRVTESMDYLFPVLFGFVVLVLLGLVWRSLKSNN